MSTELSVAEQAVQSMIGGDKAPIVNTVVEAANTETFNTETTQTTAPVVETTQVEQPKFEDLLQKEFGADVNTVKERFTKFSDLEKQVAELSEKASKTIYKTEYGKQVDEWLANGVPIDTIARFGKMDLKQMDADAKIRTMLQIKYPHSSPEHIEARFERDYLADELATDREKLLKEDDKLQAAVEAEAFLADYIGKQFATPSNEPDPKEVQKQTEIKNYWTNQTPLLSKNFEKISMNVDVPVIGQKGQEQLKVDIALEVPADTLSAITSRAMNSAIAAGLPNTEESVKEVQSYIKGLVWAEYGEKLMENYAAKREAAIWAHVQKTLDNPSILGQRATVDTTGSVMANYLRQAEQARTSSN
jgi:hypothetical protein